MNNFLTALLGLTLHSQAPIPDCNPAIGNWQNAAPTTCRFQGTNQIERTVNTPSIPQPPPPHECPPKGAETQS